MMEEKKLVLTAHNQKTGEDKRFYEGDKIKLDAGFYLMGYPTAAAKTDVFGNPLQDVGRPTKPGPKE